MADQILIDGTPTNGANPWLDSLVNGGAWDDGDGGVVTITYARVDGAEPFSNAFTGDTWTVAETTALTSAMAAWEAVANVDFVEVSPEDADIWYWSLDEANTAAFVGEGTLGYHEFPGFAQEPLYGIFNNEGYGWDANGLLPGGAGFITLIHELGHGIGLAHPHDGGLANDATNFPGVSAPFDDFGNFDLNQGIWTTMSYNDGWRTEFPAHADTAWGWQGTAMALDIAAIQLIYGANTDYHSGADTYLLPTANGSGTYWHALWDTGGTDTISAAGATAGASINLNAATLTGADAGGLVSRVANIVGGFTIANGVVIENALGGDGADTLTGNGADNTLDGGAGNDTLEGGAGTDTLIGGTGDDTYVVDGTGDLITEQSSGGTDTVLSTVNFSLAGLAEVENLTLTGSALTATGNDLDNVLTGNGGNNTLEGGAGTDTLIGGAGNDTYIVDSTGDTLTEQSSGGTDTVQSAVDFSLAALTQMENLVLTGAAIAATGNGLHNTLTGNGADNILDGASGNDTLDGGAGTDTLIGGPGNDTYVVDSADDVITELASGGTDTVKSAVSYTLESLGNVENLTLTGAALTAMGNALDNVLTGNGGNNTLQGGDGNDTLNGGAGSDTLVGGDGDDIYTFDPADTITETEEGGTDTVKTTVFLVLPAHIEKLVLMGSAALNGTGNADDNVITGNAGDNVLDGGGGNDTFSGGGGNDTYLVNGGDTVIEGDGEGTDTMRASVSTTLPAFVELLVLTGTGAVNGTGNGLNNTLTGNTAANRLSGLGGNDTLIGNGGNDTLTGGNGSDVLRGGGGNDSLTGSAGKDYFLFDAALGRTNIDTLTGFSHVDDTIRLDDDVFRKLATGKAHALPAAQYQENTTGLAGDASDRIIYNRATGDLYYDPDGTGAMARIKIGVIAGGPDNVDHTDFSVVT